MDDETRKILEDHENRIRALEVLPPKKKKNMNQAKNTKDWQGESDI